MIRFKPFNPPLTSPFHTPHRLTHVHHSPVSLQCNWWCKAALFFFPSPLLLLAWLPANGWCKPQLSLLMYFAIRRSNKSDKSPRVQKGPLSTASYAAQHPSFYDHVMCTHMKHVWLRNDGSYSIPNRCAEMWRGQTIQRRLVLKSLMSVYVYAAQQSITCPLGLIDYENQIIGYWTAMYTTLRLITEAVLWLFKETVQLHEWTCCAHGPCVETGKSTLVTCIKATEGGDFCW